MKSDLQLLVVPWPLPGRPQENGCTGTLLQGVRQFLLPGPAGNEIPFVQEHAQPILAQSIAKHFDRRLVGAVVR
jgi:hypothetical protein